MGCYTFTIFRTKGTKACDHLISSSTKNSYRSKLRTTRIRRFPLNFFLPSLRVYKSRRTQRENTSTWNKQKAATIWNKSGFVIGAQLAYLKDSGTLLLSKLFICLRTFLYFSMFSRSAFSRFAFSRSAFSRSAFSRSAFSRSAVCGLCFRGLRFRDTRNLDVHLQM